MKAVEITEDHRLRLTERPKPVPGKGEVLIRVQAAGINRPDVLQRLGKYPPPPGASDLPGLEVAGTREDTGEAVCALLPGGGYAEYAVAAKDLCLPVPEGLDMVRAAAIPETYFTVWNNVFVRGGLRGGETLLVHGGTSGIGTTAIQMAKAFGARVATTAGSDDKCAACLQLGADLAVNYKTKDFAEEIEAAWGKDSVNVVLDMVGGPYPARNIRLLAPEGRHVSIAVQQGAKGEVDFSKIMTKRLVLTGSTLRPRPVAEKAELAEGLKETIWPLIESGTVLPVLFKTFPLEKAQEAHEAMDKGDHIGKIVLTL
jgi:NADPH2:quinone reductase